MAMMVALWSLESFEASVTMISFHTSSIEASSRWSILNVALVMPAVTFVRTIDHCLHDHTFHH